MSAHDQNRETLAVIVKKAEQKFGGPSLADFANDPPIRKHYAVAEAILREFDVTPRTEEMGPAANCHLCVGAGCYEDYDGEWAECSCQREVSQTDKPTEDEQESLVDEAEIVWRAALAEVHGQDARRKYSVAEVKQIVYSFDNVLARRPTSVPAADHATRPARIEAVTRDLVADMEFHTDKERSGWTVRP